MSSLSFARTRKFVQQIVGISWKYLIPEAVKTNAWSWLLFNSRVHAFCKCHLLPRRGRAFNFFRATSVFQLLHRLQQSITILIPRRLLLKLPTSTFAIYNQLMTQAQACIRPGPNFYPYKFSAQSRDTVRAFKAELFCCLVQVQALRPTAASLEELRITLSLTMTPQQRIQRKSFLCIPLKLIGSTSHARRTKSLDGLLTEISFHTGVHLSRNYC